MHLTVVSEPLISLGQRISIKNLPHRWTFILILSLFKGEGRVRVTKGFRGETPDDVRNSLFIGQYFRVKIRGKKRGAKGSKGGKMAKQKIKYNRLQVLLMLLGVSMGLATSFPNFPMHGVATPDNIPVEMVQFVAKKIALKFSDNIVAGPIIPYCDPNGELNGYECVFAINKDAFPTQSEIYNEICSNPKWFKNYFHVLIWPVYSENLIQAYGEGLPSFYTRGSPAQEKAEKILSNNAQLTRVIWYYTPLDLLFEFTSDEDTIYIDPYRLIFLTKEKFTDRIRSGFNKKNTHYKENKNEWESFVKKIATVGYKRTDHYVVNDYNVESYRWDYGCSPTSAAMVLSYYDNGYSSYGKLNWYYHQHVQHMYTPEFLFHTPSAVKYLAGYMNTDTIYEGGTRVDSIPLGIELYTNQWYNFNSGNVFGNSANDWAWSTIVNEINASRPFVWSIINSLVAHSTCAFGYTDDKYVIIYDTWNQGRQWWNYNSYAGQPIDQVYITTVIPGGGGIYNIKLISPNGGSGWGSNSGNGPVFTPGEQIAISWDNYGNSGGSCKIEYNTCGARPGTPWYTIVDVTENDGIYYWIAPNIQSGEVRVKITHLSNEAVDGSWGDFSIIPEPWLWFRRHSLGFVEQANKIAVDIYGDVIVTGTRHNRSNWDVLTLKYSSNGDLLRQIIWDTGRNEFSNSVATDNQGNFILVESVSDGSQYFCRTVKFDSNCNLLWWRDWNTSFDDRPNDVIADHSNNIIVTGTFYNGTNWDCFTLKYNASGDLLWEKTYDGGNNEYSNAVAVDANNNIFLAQSQWNGTNADFVTVKLDPNTGNLVAGPAWFNRGYEDRPNGIAVDGWGDVIVTGNARNATDWDVLTVKYDNSLNYKWFKQYNHLDEYSNDIAVDNERYIYLAETQYNGSNHYCTTVKLDPNGNLIWAYDWDRYRDEGLDGIAIKGDAVYVCGDTQTEDSTDFVVIRYSSAGQGIITTETMHITDASFSVNLFPTPFKSKLTINCNVPKTGQASTLKIYDSSGRLIKILCDDKMPHNNCIFYWNGTDSNGNKVSSGVYFVRFECNQHSQTAKAVFVR